MNNPNMSGIPGMGAMTDTLEFVKNLWGGMNIPGMKVPGMVMPTLSVEEIDKQISDLKAVESWLTLNMNMLRGTIQALEVQSATISTLQAMGETLGAAVKASTTVRPAPEPKVATPPPQAKTAAVPAPGNEPEPASASASAAAPQANSALWWNMLQDQFKQAVSTAMVSEPAKAAIKPAPVKQPETKSAGKPKAATSARRKTTPKTAPKT